MVKKVICLQDETNSSGIYCVKMILEFFNTKEEASHLSKLCNMSNFGLSLDDIINCLKYYHIDASLYHLKLDELPNRIKYPCILQIIREQKTEYLVLYEKKGKYFICGDPRFGIVKLTYNELDDIYMDKAILVNFVSKPIKTNYLSFSKFIFEFIKTNRFVVRNIFFLSITLMMVLLTTIYFILQVIDALYIHHYHLLIVNLIGTVCLLLCLSYVNFVINRNTIQLTKNAYMHIVTKPLDNNVDLLPKISRLYQINDVGDRISELFKFSFHTTDIVLFIIKDCTIFILSILLLIIFQQRLLIYFDMIVLIGIAVILYVTNLGRKKYIVMTEYQSCIKNIRNFFRYFQNTKYMQYNHDIDSSKHLGSLEKILYLQNKSIFIFQIMIIFILLLFCMISYLHIVKYPISILKLTLNIISLIISSRLLFQYRMILNKYHFTKRYFEFFKLLNQDKFETIDFNQKITSIMLRNVSFSYQHTHLILEYIDENFSGHYFVTGNNGCGKTTFLKLISGNLDDYNGEIFINGININEIDVKSLNKKIVYIDQNTAIYEVRVYDFLIKNCSSSKDFLMDLIDKYELNELQNILPTFIDSEGNGLSNSQKLLVIFIRSMLLNYDVYILDDIFTIMDESLREKIFLILNDTFFKDKMLFIVDQQINHSNSTKNCVIIKDKKVEIVRTNHD